MKKVLVIVVTYNGMKWMERCLGSLRSSSFPVDSIVVDNGSTDGTPEYVRTVFPEVTVFCTGENLGFGKANNIGLCKALDEGYDYVYLLNQDAWVFPDTVGTLVEAMESDGSIGILSPMQMAACVDRPDPRFRRRCPKEAFLDVKKGVGRLYEVPFVMAAHWMVSAACVKKVGGFSPAFPHYGEDDNFIHRARYKGFRVGIHSGATAVHDRETRPMSKATHMKLKGIASVVKISNPLNCLWLRKIIQPFQLMAAGVWYRSGYLFRFAFSLIGSYPRLTAIRTRSFQDGAFLEQS